jgi:trigger factor
LNVQTERLENHTARFTVEVEAERLEKAKREAARKLANRVNIPGFRKGKAPYKVLVSYVGEGAVLEDAIEVLGNEVYKDVINSADVEPYGPGSLEDFALEPQPTFKFVVPLQPTADLGNYRDIRIEYEAPVVEDKDVDEALNNMLEREALIEESHKPVEAGNRVTVSMKAEYLDDAPKDEAEAAEATVLEGEEAEETEAPEENKVFIDNDNLVFRLTSDREPAPGFTDALVGVAVGEQREFEITYPDDEKEYEHLAGRRVKFNVTVKKIETLTLPELNDEFAARVTQAEAEREGKEPLTLLQLRMRIREDLEKEAKDAADAAYAQKVLDKITEGATFAYPEALVSDEVHHLLEHLDSDLRRRGLTLEDYQRVTNKTHEDLHVDYHDNAVESIKRSLTMRELIRQEGLEVTDEQVNAEIDRIAERFGEQAAAFRGIYESGPMRENLRSDLLYRQLTERVAAIGKGEAPEKPQLAAETTALADEENTDEGEAS